MMPQTKKSVSTKGLDEFAAQFLKGDTSDGEEYISVSGGQKVADSAIETWRQQRLESFIERAGSFCEDLIGFFLEQKRMRSLSDHEAVFALALASINLRNAYGSPQGDEEDITPQQSEEYLKEFDSICWGAQQFWDAHANDPDGD